VPQLRDGGQRRELPHHGTLSGRQLERLLATRDTCTDGVGGRFRVSREQVQVPPGLVGQRDEPLPVVVVLGCSEDQLERVDSVLVVAEQDLGECLAVNSGYGAALCSRVLTGYRDTCRAPRSTATRSAGPQTRALAAPDKSAPQIWRYSSADI
jgi:hypothetical protein